MKTNKWTIIFLLFTGIILFAAQSALGGCEVADLDFLISDEKAPGTKLEGPLTLFYQLPPGEISGPADLYWFIRLRKGSMFYSFAGGPAAITFPTDILTEVPIIIGEFFDTTVVQNLYPGCELTTTDTCPNIVLKSADMGVDWEPPGDNSGLFFFIANIRVAIHD
jgi:hypothetical protein